jgi:hypothetical protein
MLVGCSSYHTKSLKYQSELDNGLLKQAYKSVDANKFLKKKRNKLLYLLEKGKIAHLNQNYTESNLLFNEADLLVEDSRKRIGDEILAVITNPERTPYKSEDFEKVAIHYYKSLNYIFLNNYDEALVEARRINLQLQKINDKYPAGKKNRYTSDAFALNLQGILYEVTGNTNDAFISYRNAIDLYLKEKGTYFGVDAPEQLKKDLLKTAHFLGFTNEKERYSNLLKIKLDTITIPKRELIVFWENGTTPYKDQTYYTFSVLPGANSGMFNITNEELGLNINLPINNQRNQSGKFSDIDVFNVAFPKYVSKTPYYINSYIKIDSTKRYYFEKAQDYNQIAFKTLKDRTAREIGKIALRLAVKKITEYSVKDKNENLGALLGIFNAITERTDTRNWQTLPHSIYYSRIALDDNDSEVNILFQNKSETKSKTFKLDPKKKIQFITVSTLKSVKTN